jgi:hypothetical protein
MPEKVRPSLRSKLVLFQTFGYLRVSARPARLSSVKLWSFSATIGNSVERDSCSLSRCAGKKRERRRGLRIIGLMFVLASPSLGEDGDSSGSSAGSAGRIRLTIAVFVTLLLVAKRATMSLINGKSTSDGGIPVAG